MPDDPVGARSIQPGPADSPRPADPRRPSGGGTPSRYANFVAQALVLRPEDAVIACTPFAAELLAELARAAPLSTLRLVTADLRAAEAAEAATRVRGLLPPRR